MPTPAPENPIRLTMYGAWSDIMVKPGTLQRHPTLTEQLKAAGVPYEQMPVPHLVGMGGEARLIFYTSPKTQQPVTVLLVPHHYDLDAWAEDYYYFVGMTRDRASESEQFWIDAYAWCDKHLHGRTV